MKEILLCTLGLIFLSVLVESIPAEIPQAGLRKKGGSSGPPPPYYPSYGNYPSYGYYPQYQGQSQGQSQGCGYECDYELQEIAYFLYYLNNIRNAKNPTSGGYQYPKPPNAAAAEVILNRLRSNTPTNKLVKNKA